MRRRTYRSPTPVPPRRKPVALAIAARPAPSLGAVVLLGLALLLALVLPQLAGAKPAAVAQPELQLGEGVARLHLETPTDAPVLVEWGMAPTASRVVRSSGGTSHDLVLKGLEPGRIYVYRVIVGGRVVTPATPFRTPGAVPATGAPLSI
ncbi:hypothetical protein [Vulgatibacter sp.]|uniref:hypothetical protein n=1 Tax=Vulgatibacter sp. TaxID=1971226 RepID=UPI0035646BCD